MTNETIKLNANFNRIAKKFDILNEIDFSDANETKPKTDLSNTEISAMYFHLLDFFAFCNVKDQNDELYFIRTFENLSDVFGLPYTSSGDYAGLWNTNSQVYIDIDKKWSIQGFTLSHNLEVLLIVSNDGTDETKFLIIGEIGSHLSE